LSATSVAPEAPAVAGALPESRASRALAIYVQHADSIIASWRRGTWLVPSCSDPDVKYRVRLLPSPSCSCPDARKGPCKHIEAVRVARRVTAPCAGCGHRFRRRDLVEVGEANVSLGAFVGDRLCEPCGLNAGVL
jgi:hypothetical protein